MEAERKQLTFAYRIGVTTAKYFKETLYHKWEETLLFHSLDTRLEMKQAWGEIYLDLRAQQYPTLKNFYNLKLNTDISVRLSSSFSFFLNTRVQKIHD